MNATPTPAVATTVAVGLAKDGYELAFAEARFCIVKRKRLRRGPFARLLENRELLHVGMQACRPPNITGGFHR